MVSKAAATIAVAIAAVIVAAALNLRKNIAKARKTGLKYIVLRKWCLRKRDGLRS